MKKVVSDIENKNDVDIIKSRVVDTKKDKDVKLRVAILIPHTHPNYSSDFFLTITALLSHTYYWNYNNENKYAFDLVTPPKNLAGIDKIRNGLTMIALQQQADYLFWIDSDQVCSPDTIVKMLRHFERADNDDEDLKGVEAIGGLITYKTPPYVPHIYVKKHEKKNTYHLARTFALDQLMEVEGVGFGCVMIKSEVFNRVKKPWFEFQVDDKGELISGEDLGFCVKAKMKIVIDPTIIVKHQQLTSFDINDFIKYNKLEVEDGKVIPSKEQANAIYDEHLGIKTKTET